MKRLSLIIMLLMLLAFVPLIWLTATEDGLQWAYKKGESYLPGGLKISSLKGRLMGPITFNGVDLRQEGALLKAGSIVLDWHPAALLAANINISRMRIKSLEIVLPEADKSGAPLTLPDINVLWHTVLKDGQIDDFSLKHQGGIIRLKQIRLGANALLSKIYIKELGVIGDSFNLNIKGELRPKGSYFHDLEINWRAALSSGAVIDGEGRLTGDLKKTVLKQLLRGPLQVELDAELKELIKQPSWQAGIEVSSFEAGKLDSSLPDMSGALQLKGKGDLTRAELDGTFKGRHPDTGPLKAVFKLRRLESGAIQIDRLNLHSSKSDTKINASGLWTPGDDGGDIKLNMDWQKLRWPMQDKAWFSSSQGSASVQGKLDKYQIKLRSDSPWPGLLPSSWSAAADGDLNGLNIESLRVEALSGKTVAAGRIDWSPGLSWQINVKADDINPGIVWPEWPGRIKADLTSRGRTENNLISAEADIKDLTGELRGYPLSLSGRLKWRDDGLHITPLKLRSGSSLVSAKGKVGDTVNMDWAIHTENMAELYPKTKGSLKAEGHISGPRTTPAIQALFKGEALELPGYRAGKIEGEANADLFKWQKIILNLSAMELEAGDYNWQSLEVSTRGQRYEIKAVSEKLTAMAGFKSRKDKNGWHGRIDMLELSSRQFYSWQLKAPFNFDIGEEGGHIQPLCLTSGESKLCLAFQKQDHIWDTKLSAEQIPIMILSPWLPVDLKFEGKVKASAGLQFRSPDELYGQGRIEMQAGRIDYPVLEGERDFWDYSGGSLLFTLNNKGIKLSADIGMSNGDSFNIKTELPEAKLLAFDYRRQRLRAEADLSLHDLGIIEALLPDTQDLKGEFALKLSAGGTITRPRLDGNVHLINGTLRIPRLGLTISDLNLNGQRDSSGKFNLTMDALSGKGRLNLKSQTLLSRAKGWPTSVTIKGNDFQISRIPEAAMLISPDLQIEMKNQNIKIRGDIRVPYARLQPKDITLAEHVSEDAVIIGGKETIQEKWLIDTRVRLELGKEVDLYGFGFEGRLEGNLLLEDEPGHLTRATGEITTPEGNYRAYGQRLNIEMGRLLFTGGPLADPGLDLRAVRQVGSITSGLKVRGSLRKPQLELFSLPAMGQTDALAYLLLGIPIENASDEQGAMMAKAALALGISGGEHLARTIGDRFGLDEMRVESSDEGEQASLVVGRYLSPRLYVSYGVGLVESFNTLKLRYRLSDQWQIKAESGEYQGADLLYTIDR